MSEWIDEIPYPGPLFEPLHFEGDIHKHAVLTRARIIDWRQPYHEDCHWKRGDMFVWEGKPVGIIYDVLEADLDAGGYVARWRLYVIPCEYY